MPRRKGEVNVVEQSARFRAEVERMVAAGELDPTEAEAGLERAVTASRKAVDESSGIS